MTIGDTASHARAPAGVMRAYREDVILLASTPDLASSTCCSLSSSIPMCTALANVK